MATRELAQRGLFREFGQGLLAIALAGTSVGGLLGMVAVATRALGR
jgi:hypothetical protein